MARLAAHERVVAVSVSTALLMAGQGIQGPVLPLFARQFGVGVAAVGLTVAAFGLARLLFNVPFGILADRRGRRLLMVGGPLVVAVSMVGAGMAGGIPSLTVWRFLSGAGSAMYMTGALVYLADISTPANRARLIGVNQGALLIGTSIGPGVGGMVAQQWGLRAPFYVVAGAAAASFVYAFLRLPETRPARAEAPAPRPEGARPMWRALLASPAFLAVALVNFSVFLTRGTSRNTLMPLVGVDMLGLSVGDIGWVLTAMALVNLVLLAPASYAADRHGRGRVIVPSLVGTGLGLGLLAAAGTVSAFLVAAGVLALATSVVGPAPAALAADSTSDEDRGMALGLFRTFGDLGLLVGPPALGLVADVGGYSWAFGVNAVVVVAAAVVFVWARSGER